MKKIFSICLFALLPILASANPIEGNRKIVAAAGSSTEGQMTAQDLEIDNYPAHRQKYDGTNAIEVTTTWSQFSHYILYEKLSNTSLQAFDDSYWADCEVGEADVSADDTRFVTPKAKTGNSNWIGSGIAYQLKLFNFGKDIYGTDGTLPAEGSIDSFYAPMGTALYYPSGEGTGNHMFQWLLPTQEIETLIKGKTSPVTITRWLHFAAKDPKVAAYPNLWVKMTIEISFQNASQPYIYGEKNSNYWHNWNPNGTLDNSLVMNGWSALEFYIEPPRDFQTTKNYPWISRISDALVQNRVAIEGKSKYYFAPKGDISITAQDGTVYTITPQCETNRDTYNKLISQSGEQFVWDEATLEETLKNNTIVYGGESAGVFSNDILYAYANGKYTPIVRLTQEQDFDVSSSQEEAGSLELIKYLPIGSGVSEFLAGNATENTVLFDVLNAVGYPDDADYAEANINRQLRAWLGYVKNDGNNVAQYVEQGKYDDDNKATFLASWKRPLNASLMETSTIKSEEQYIYIIDYLRLYDWRGDKPNRGYMYDDQYWHWGYYNVKEIDVDLRPERVLTNLRQQQADSWVPLSTVSTQIKLETLDGTASLGKYSFDLAANQNFLRSDFEPLVEQYLGLNPEDDSKKANFGGIHYQNLTESDRDFTVQVPVTVRYEFGNVSTMMKIVFGNGGQTAPETVTFTTSRGMTYEADPATLEAKLTAVSTELTGEVRVPEVVINSQKAYTVTQIGGKAFEGCTQVETVELPKSVNTFEAGALSGCKSLKTINVIAGGESLKSDGGVLYSADGNVLMAYPAARGAKYEIPASVKSILDGAFAYAQLYVLTVGASDPAAIAVGNAFEGFDFESCELSVPLGAAAAYRNHAVWGKFKNIAGEQKVTVGNTTYSIGEDGGVKFTGVDPAEAKGEYEIPAEIEVEGKKYPVTEIAPGAFENCTDMTRVTIPKDITTIGGAAFRGCINLEEIICESPQPVELSKLLARTRSGAVVTQFEGIDFDTCVLYVPVGSKEAYQNAEGWRLFKNIVELQSLGISDVTMPAGSDIYYNLQGQRVSLPTCGLYIKNGRKVLVSTTATHAHP